MTGGAKYGLLGYGTPYRYGSIGGGRLIEKAGFREKGLAHGQPLRTA